MEQAHALAYRMADWKIEEVVGDAWRAMGRKKKIELGGRTGL